MSMWILAMYVVGTQQLAYTWGPTFRTEQECMDTGRILASQWHANPLKIYPVCREEEKP